MGCVVGALFGFALGYYLFDLIGEWVIASFSSLEQWETVKQGMAKDGFDFIVSLGILFKSPWSQSWQRSFPCFSI